MINIKKFFALLLTISTLLCLVACGSASNNGKAGSSSTATYEDALKNYEAMLNGEADIIEAMAPKSFWEWAKSYCEENGMVYDMDAAKANFKIDHQEMISSSEAEVGANAKISLSINNAVQFSDEQLASAAASLNLTFSISESTVQEAVLLDCTATMVGDDDRQEVDNQFVAIRIDGNWYIAHYDEYDGQIECPFVVVSVIHFD